MNKKLILFSLIIFAGIIFPRNAFSQKQKPQVNTVDIRDVGFRLIGIFNSEWTEYKKKKLTDEYIHFLDSTKAVVTVRVEMKNYAYDERKKLTTCFTKPAEFEFDAEEDMKLRISVDPFTLKGDSLLRALVVVKDIPTYIDVTGRITKPRIGEVQATPREKRKDFHLTLVEARAGQAKDRSENPYYWRRTGKIIPSLSGIIEKRKLTDGFDLTGLGFRKVTER